MKENLKPCAYKQQEERSDCVLFVERSGELLIIARLNTYKVWSRRETESEEGGKLVLVDPKPGDLSMSRLKLP